MAPESVGITTSNLGPVECAEVRYNPNGPNQNVIVFRDDKWPYSDPNNTLGLTTVTFNADTGEILRRRHGDQLHGKNLSTGDTVPANGFDLLSVITHEAGHFLGLAHATNSTATMYASYKPGTSTLRTLTADDIAGVCEIYPSTAERTVDKRSAPPVQSRPTLAMPHRGTASARRARRTPIRRTPAVEAARRLLRAPSRCSTSSLAALTVGLALVLRRKRR